MNNLKDAFIKLSILADDLKLNTSKLSHPVNYSRPRRIQENANEMWDALSPVLCGHGSEEDEENTNEGGGSSIIPELLEGGGESTHALKIMLYMLTHDPMILYAPNGTEADEVVRRVRFPNSFFPL